MYSDLLLVALATIYIVDISMRQPAGILRNKKMNIYIDLILVALVTIYIVDISGFTESWRAWCANRLHISKMKPLPPFDCGKCMTWWVCLIYALCTGHFNLGTIAFSALLSLLSNPIGESLIFIREWMTWIIDRLMP